MAVPTNCAAGRPLRGITASRTVSVGPGRLRTAITPLAMASCSGAASICAAARASSCVLISPAAICAARPTI
ncbi:hypothetical protein D3C85_1404360 [compost metagenome]